MLGGRDECASGMPSWPRQCAAVGVASTSASRSRRLLHGAVCIGCAYRLPADGFLVAVTMQVHALVRSVPYRHALASNLGLGWSREANYGRQALTSSTKCNLGWTIRMDSHAHDPECMVVRRGCDLGGLV